VTFLPTAIWVNPVSEKRYRSRIYNQSFQMNDKTPFSAEILKQLMERDESENLEFKSSLVDARDISEYCVGIGNAGGGFLILGISDSKQRKICGIPEQKAADLMHLRRSIFSSIDVDIVPQGLMVDDKFVVAISIPARPQVIFFALVLESI